MTALSDDLAQLASLRDEGVLTETEFAAQKERLLHGAAAPPTGTALSGKSVGGYAIIAAGAGGVLLLAGMFLWAIGLL